MVAEVTVTTYGLETRLTLYQSECHVTDCAVWQSDQMSCSKHPFAPLCSCRELHYFPIVLAQALVVDAALVNKTNHQITSTKF